MYTKSMTIRKEIEKRLEQIENEIKNAKAWALCLYDDPCEVAFQYAVIDELILEREKLLSTESQSLSK